MLKKNLIVFYGLLLVFAFGNCESNTIANRWQLVYKSDSSGNTLLGNKQKLINAIRQGASIKIAWGFKGSKHSIEHLSDPIWLAILDEQEVIAHLDPQVLSTIDWEALNANYADSTKLLQEWRVVISTKGGFDAVWYDRNNFQLLERRPQNHPITWFAKDIQTDKENVQPLFIE